MAITCPECGTEAWEHPAGPCLDKWVAKIIFQQEPCSLWRQINFGSAGGPVYEKRCAHESGRCYPATPVQTMQGILGGPPRYSTDMGKAWLIVEKITAEGACPGLINDDKQHWALSQDGIQNVTAGEAPETIETLFWVEKYRWCNSAALAICRAVIANAEEGSEDAAI